MKKNKLKDKFYKKFGIEQYQEDVGFFSSGKMVTSKEMWDWIEKALAEQREEHKHELEEMEKRIEKEQEDTMKQLSNYQFGWNDALNKAIQIIKEPIDPNEKE